MYYKRIKDYGNNTVNRIHDDCLNQILTSNKQENQTEIETIDANFQDIVNYSLETVMKNFIA